MTNDPPDQGAKVSQEPTLEDSPLWRGLAEESARNRQPDLQRRLARVRAAIAYCQEHGTSTLRIPGWDLQGD